MAEVIQDLLGGAARTLTNVTPGTTDVTPSVQLRGPITSRWLAEFHYEGLAGDGGGTDTFHPILQTSFDNGTTWLDLASTASMNGGVVTAVVERIEALTPKAAARVAASDGALAASTINATALGPLVRIRGKITDVDNDGQWQLNKARLMRYPG